VGAFRARYRDSFTFTDKMNVLKAEKKGKHLNILEKYHTYKISKTNYT
jgi:hypothetical protein